MLYMSNINEPEVGMVTKQEKDYIDCVKHHMPLELKEEYERRKAIWHRAITDKMSHLSSTYSYLASDEFKDILKLGKGISVIFIEDMVKHGPGMGFKSYEMLRGETVRDYFKGTSKRMNDSKQCELMLDAWFRSQNRECEKLSSKTELSSYEQAILEDCCPLLGAMLRSIHKTLPTVKSKSVIYGHSVVPSRGLKDSNVSLEENPYLAGETTLSECESNNALWF